LAGGWFVLRKNTVGWLLLERECLEVGDAARVVIDQVCGLVVRLVDDSTGGSGCNDQASGET
jgi:hypothetical protein